MANIAFIQHRLGGTDGVSLEVDKWRKILEGMGHRVIYIAGNEDVPGGHCIPEMHPLHPVTNKILKNATRELADYDSGQELLKAVYGHANELKPKICRILGEENIKLLIPNNLGSVGYNLPGMLALYEILLSTGLPAICHNHDFWWEDSGEVYPTCPEVIQFYQNHGPPKLPNVSHVVINRIAQKQLKHRRDIDAEVVGNVFDFDQPAWLPDDYNSDFRDSIGVGANDLLFLQATRVLDRKGIELAIDLIAELQSPENLKRLHANPLYDGRKFGSNDRIVLVCAGYVESIGLSGSYASSLQSKADELGVKIVWCGDQVKHSRSHDSNGEKIYSLWDSYTTADFVTYPSYWEGWGNQLIEAVFAKLPIVLFEYPVYLSDLAELELDVASLGSEIEKKDSRELVKVPEENLKQATSKVIELLLDKEKRKHATENNYASMRSKYSYESLEKIISKLLEKLNFPDPVTGKSGQ